MTENFRIFLVAITLIASGSLMAKELKGSTKLLRVETLAPLALEKPLESGRPSHVSAASGIVERNGRYYINSDDENALFSWKIGDKTVTPFILEKGDLGAANEIRKKLKPDYESLLLLDEKQWPPFGALVVWPSASTEKRVEVSVANFNENGNLDKIQKVNIAGLAKTLSSQVKKLNLEGLTLHNGKAYLFNRGNGSDSGLKSGYFEITDQEFLKGLKGEGWPSKVVFQKVKIGKLKGVKLTLADGLWTKFGFLGLAPAEDSESAVADGKVTGTVLVRIDGKRGQVLGQFDLNKKFEGFLTKEVGDGLEIMLVDDADDPNIPSHIYRAHLTKKDLD